MFLLLPVALAASPPPLPPPLDRVDEGPTVWTARYLDARERSRAAPWLYPLGPVIGALAGSAAFGLAAAQVCHPTCIVPGGAITALPVGFVITTVGWTAMAAGLHHRAVVDRREAAWHLCRDGGLADGPLPQLDEEDCQRRFDTFPAVVPDARNPGDWPLPTGDDPAP
jgi:hypothetical protein